MDSQSTSLALPHNASDDDVPTVVLDGDAKPGADDHGQQHDEETGHDEESHEEAYPRGDKVAYSRSQTDLGLQDEEIPTLLPELSLQLSPDISKAIDLEDCLEKFGKHWHGTVTGGFGVTEEDQDLAKCVTEVDDFLSHDWVTDGKLKFITLCIVYNSTPAAIAAITISSAFGLLEVYVPELRLIEGFFVWVGNEKYDVETAGFFGLAFGMLTFVTVLMFWQRIRAIVFCRSRKVFMDKLCIDQRDPAKKAKGILGLAGFLRISDRLVVLWSPRYFTRIWCVYEIATWMYLQKPLSKIVIAPVAQGAFVALVMAGMILVVAAMVWLARLQNYTVYGLSLTATIAGIMILPLHCLRRLVRDLRKMPEQINNFAFSNSECFCCDVDHVIPGTGQHIPCDRKVITNKLTSWFGEAAEKQGARASLGGRCMGPVQLFDRYVRREFGRHILRRVGGARVTYPTATIASLPGWFYMTDRFHLLSEMGSSQWRLSLHYLTATLGFFPSVIRLALEFANILDRMFGVRANRYMDAMVTAVGVVGISGFTLVWLFLMDLLLMNEHFVPQVLMALGTAVLTALLYLPDLLFLVSELNERGKTVTVKTVHSAACHANSAKQKVQKAVHVSAAMNAWGHHGTNGSSNKKEAASSNMSKVVPFHDS